MSAAIATGDLAATFRTARRGNTIRVGVDHLPASWRLLVGVRSISRVGDGTSVPHEQGVLVEAPGRRLVVALADQVR